MAGARRASRRRVEPLLPRNGGPLMSGGRALQCTSFRGSRLLERIKLDGALEQDKQAGLREAKGLHNAFLPLPHSSTTGTGMRLHPWLTGWGVAAAPADDAAGADKSAPKTDSQAGPPPTLPSPHPSMRPRN